MNEKPDLRMTVLEMLAGKQYRLGLGHAQNNLNVSIQYDHCLFMHMALLHVY